MLPVLRIDPSDPVLNELIEGSLATGAIPPEFASQQLERNEAAVGLGLLKESSLVHGKFTWHGLYQMSPRVQRDYGETVSEYLNFLYRPQ